MGFTWENDLHLYYRRAKASETTLGDATFHRERIARLVIDAAGPRRSRPHRMTKSPRTTAVGILAAISVSHLLNDTIQSLIPAIYPMLKVSLRLNFAQVGLITLTLQLTASLLQPLVGMYTDRRPMPYSLVVGMAFTLVGLLLLSVAATLGAILRRRRADGRRLVGLPSGVVARSRAWRPAAGTASRSRCSRSAATSGRRSARCWRRSSSCRAASRASPGARCSRVAAIVLLATGRPLVGAPPSARDAHGVRGRAGSRGPALSRAPRRRSR